MLCALGEMCDEGRRTLKEEERVLDFVLAV